MFQLIEKAVVDFLYKYNIAYAYGNPLPFCSSSSVIYSNE